MQFINSYHSLGEEFYEPVEPAPVKDPQLFLWNESVAQELQMPAETSSNEPLLAQLFSGNQLLEGSEPIALAYAGHQFGHFNPQLGDGRAHLLGDVIGKSGATLDVQLKGSGRTPFSRGGDGRCAMGPAIREFIMSEAMAALGVPTTRCLAVVTTGEPVYREEVLPGAVVTRVASSHVRVGTFQFFAAQGNVEAVKKLCDFAIARHYPELATVPEEEKYLSFLNAVVEKQIALVCEWMRVGFIHGVMNTDNTAISGDTIDFGPCAMMSQYSPNAVFSSIDAQGRYRFGHQPSMAQWNLVRLAECLLPLFDEDENKAVEKASAVMNQFNDKFKQAYMAMLAGKIGLTQFSESEDEHLLALLLETLKSKAMDYTQTFDLLTKSFASQAIASEMKTELGDWYVSWKERLAQQQEAEEDIANRMRQSNPVVIPRNHHIERVLEECIASGSPRSAHEILAVLRNPYEEMDLTRRFQDPPADGDRAYQTFCGT